MNIMLNGSPRPLSSPITVGDLLAELGLDPTRVAVEHNLAIISRESFASTAVEDGDTLEIVQFVGGG